MGRVGTYVQAGRKTQLTKVQTPTQRDGCLSLWLSHMHRYTLDTDLQGCPSIHHPGTCTFYLQRIRDQSPDKAADASDEHLAGTENKWRALFQPRRICPSSVSRLLGRRCTHLVSNSCLFAEGVGVSCGSRSLMKQMKSLKWYNMTDFIRLVELEAWTATKFPLVLVTGTWFWHRS